MLWTSTASAPGSHNLWPVSFQASPQLPLPPPWDYDEEIPAFISFTPKYLSIYSKNIRTLKGPSPFFISRDHSTTSNIVVYSSLSIGAIALSYSSRLLFSLKFDIFFAGFFFSIISFPWGFSLYPDASSYTALKAQPSQGCPHHPLP